MKNTLLIILLIIGSICKAQDSDPANGKYLRLNTPYTFDFPMFNLSMQLPKNAEFRVPFWQTNNALLEVENKNVTYFYDVNTVSNDDVTFKYLLPQTNENFTLSFKNCSSSELELIKHSHDRFIKIPDIQSNLGTFNGAIIFFFNDIEIRDYQLIKDNFLISFTISSSLSKKNKQCEKIIASLDFSDLTEKQNKYLDLVSSGYFEEKENTEIESFEDKIDKTSAETTFSFPAFGLKMTYPENWETTIRSTESAIKKNKNTTEVQWSPDDLNKQGFLMFDGRNKNMLVMTRILKKAEIPDFSQGTKLLKKFPIVVDGIQTEAKLTGLQEKANLFFNINLQSHVICFSVYDILLEEVPLLESIIATIHFSEKEKSGLTKASSDIMPLNKQLNLKPYSAEILPEYKLNNPDSSNLLPKIQTSFKDAGISFFIPYGNEMSYPDDSEIEKNKIIIKGKAERKYKRISTELSNNQTLEASIYYFNNDKSFEDYFENSFRNIKQYTKIRKAGFTTVNNKNWGILEYTLSRKRRYEFSTTHNDAEFTISLSSQKDLLDPKNQAELESMLFSVRFD